MEPDRKPADLCTAYAAGAPQSSPLGEVEVTHLGEVEWTSSHRHDYAAGGSARRRPAVVISNGGVNAAAARLGRGVVTVVPVTSNVARVYPFRVSLPAGATGLQRDSKAQAEQIRSVSMDQLGARLGSAPADVMLELDEALRLNLAL
jgi:mRNA interferase MazF